MPIWIILKDFETCLRDVWQLSIKDGSRDVDVCKALKGAKHDGDDLWTRVDKFNCLGHWVANNCGVRGDWQVVKPKMWTVFWMNSANSRIHGIKLEAKLRLLMRTVLLLCFLEVL